MKIKTCKCPECGELAQGTIERMTGLAELNIDEATGEAEYDGHTEVWWDEQKTVNGDNGLPLLQCPAGHEWESEIEGLQQPNPAALRLRIKTAARL